MPTRRDLHDRARQEQRHQLQAAKADSPKSAIVGMGKRDPQTGLFAVQTGDGVDGIGEKQFNSALPEGSQVLGIPKETGGWVLDERDVKPTIAPIIDAPKGKIKYLYSIVNADGKTELRVGGWQKRSVLVRTFEPGTILFPPSIDNLANNAWSVNLGYFRGETSTYTFERLTPKGTLWSKTYNRYALFLPFSASRGFGFWSVVEESITTLTGGFDGVVTGTWTFLDDGVDFALPFSGTSLGATGYGITFESLIMPTVFRGGEYYAAGPGSLSAYEALKIDEHRTKGVGLRFDFVAGQKAVWFSPLPEERTVEPALASNLRTDFLDVRTSGFTLIDPTELIDSSQASDIRSKDKKAEVKQYTSEFVKAKTFKEKVFKVDISGDNFTFYNASYHK